MTGGYESFKPNEQDVFVGDDQILKVREYTIAQRDKVAKILVEKIKITEALKPLFDRIKQKPTEIKDDIDSSFVEIFFSAILNVVGNGLSDIMCITLNTPANRKKLGVKNENEMNNWILGHVTARQEVAILRAILETNDFLELGKNYMGLLSRQSAN